MSVWRVQLVGAFGRRHDAFIDADPGARIGDLGRALEDEGFRGQPLGLDGRSRSADETLAEAELEHGATITCGGIGAPAAHLSPGRYLTVVAGPDAGRSLPVAPRLTIGRGGRDLVLDDPFLSTHHCTLRNAGGTLAISDAGSTNGTRVEGTTVDGEVELTPGAYVQVGSSVLTVVDVDADDLGVLGYRSPDRVFPRQFRTALTALPRALEAPRPADRAGSRARFNWWRGLLPLVTGAGMAAITGRWIFLLIMAVSPIVITFDAVGRKRRAREDEERDTAEYRRAVEEFRAEVVDVRRTERARRRDSATCGGVALLTAAMRHRRLWERSPFDPDFTSVAVGLADLPSDVHATDPDGLLDPRQWGTPLETNLLDTGSLAVVGPRRRARAVARGLVMSLATTHSPTELRIWLLTDDDDGTEWGFARWLPHTFDGDRGSHIATDERGRAMAVKSIKQLLDTRAELGATERPLPIHLVVIDGTDHMSPGELADLLGRGPQHGIVGMTVDGRLAPEGIGATLTVTTTADANVFESRHQPRTEGVIVPAVDPDLAEWSARRMASLRPMRHDEAAGLGATVHLVDLVDGLSPGAIGGQDVLDRWAARSPDTAAVIGTASDTPMVVDLVRDGPHGLVGGTSGSGKTELLKTLFVSLCLNNHPDDLSIVIVDFKGGVDHDAVRPIPHVVDVATNLDIEQFKRTIVMLKAESRRRQDLLARAGTSNIDAYRIARTRDPRLGPLPRLLVVVDEFGELLASDSGREQLKELESITRIGRALGINLLLVTQNFEGNLPSQIDANAGMRICLRVQKSAHSKAVLNASVAATIPDRFVGRAYARFHGRDLIEFQTARVAGRRRGLTSIAAAVDVRVVPFAALAAPPPERRAEDVPAEETDMHALVGAIRDAATASGWRSSAVPWPAALPEHVSVSALVERHHLPGVPVALVDLPEEQRRGISSISDRDEQLVLIGGPNAPLAEVLTSYGASLALLRPARDVHLYGIDLIGRSLGQLGDLPHCGGVAVRNEALALRIVRWMIDMAAERKVAIATTASSSVWEHSAATGEPLPPQLVLLVSGADRLLMSAEGPASNLVGPLTTLLAEAIGVRMQVVLAGLPRIVNNRLGMNIERRFVFQLPDANEYSAVGARRSVAADLVVARRAFETPAKRIVQLAELAGPGRPDGVVIQELAARLPAPTSSPPRRFAEVPWPQPWPQAPLDALDPPEHLLSPLPVGIDTRSGEWAWIDALDDGPVFAVAGPPKSGRSSALATMARLARRVGWSVVDVTASRRSPLARWDDPAVAAHVAPADVGATLDRIPGDVVVLFDDLQRLTTYDPLEAALAHRSRALIVVAGPPDFLGSRLGMLRSFPMASAGLLLAPTSALDGGAVGLRRLAPEMISSPRAGRGILAVAGEPSDIQVPFVPLG